MTNHKQWAEILEKVRTGHLKVVSHSAKSGVDTVFVLLPPARPSGQPDSHYNLEHLEQALGKGAQVVVCPSEISAGLEGLRNSYPDSLYVFVESTRAALGQLATAMYGTDKASPTLIGITGTNGKTTESYLLEHIFSAAGYKTGVIGTVSYRWPGYEEDAPLTTPGCLELHALLQKMQQAGVDYAFMEVSSHALDQDRVAGLSFAGGLFTNLTQDHLDYHPDMEHYFAAKAKLFLPESAGGLPGGAKRLACNMDDPFGLRLLHMVPEAIGYGLEAREDVFRQCIGSVVTHDPSGLKLHLDCMGSLNLSAHLVGLFNAHNILGAVALARAFELPEKVITSLQYFMGIPGRLQKVRSSKGLHAFVDYAHTPDALLNVLQTLRDVGFKRIITVFGCGGNRDKTKRPIMGKVVSDHSDVVVVTSDNPRNEDPAMIIQDILPGTVLAKQVLVEADRRKAIAAAVKMLAPEDVLLVAGKGHETYQIIGDKKYDFSDTKVLEEFLA